jgi:hypothetical protein
MVRSRAAAQAQRGLHFSGDGLTQPALIFTRVVFMGLRPCIHRASSIVQLSVVSNLGYCIRIPDASQGARAEREGVG